jgi:hypothetical protein
MSSASLDFLESPKGMLGDIVRDMSRISSLGADFVFSCDHPHSGACSYGLGDGHDDHEEVLRMTCLALRQADCDAEKSTIATLHYSLSKMSLIDSLMIWLIRSVCLDYL